MGTPGPWSDVGRDHWRGWLSRLQDEFPAWPQAPPHLTAPALHEVQEDAGLPLCTSPVPGLSHPDSSTCVSQERFSAGNPPTSNAPHLGPSMDAFLQSVPKESRVCVCACASAHSRTLAKDWSSVSFHSVSTLSRLSAFFPSHLEPNRVQQAKTWHLPRNSILSLGPWGGTWVPIRVFVSLWMPGSNFQPFPDAWRMDLGNQRDTTSPPTSSGQGPPMAPHLPLLNLSAAAWLLCLPCPCPGPSPSCTTNHSVTLDLSG